MITFFFFLLLKNLCWLLFSNPPLLDRRRYRVAPCQRHIYVLHIKYSVSSRCLHSRYSMLNSWLSRSGAPSTMSYSFPSQLSGAPARSLLNMAALTAVQTQTVAAGNAPGASYDSFSSVLFSSLENYAKRHFCCKFMQTVFTSFCTKHRLISAFLHSKL